MEQILKKTSIRKKLCTLWILALIAIFSYFIIKDAALTLGDDRQFLPLLRDNNLLYGWFGDHRFWPLGLADYNIFILFPTFKNPTGLYIYNAIIMCLFIITMFQLLQKILIQYTQKFQIETITITLTSLMLSSNFLNIHINIIYPERMIIFMLSIFMLCTIIGKIKQSNLLYFSAILAATYATYCKEPIFEIIAIIATTNLIFNYKNLSKKDRYFFAILLTESLIYITTYFLITHNDSYSYNRPLIVNSQLEMIRNTLKGNLYTYLIFGLSLFRTYKLIFKKETKYILSDSFLFAGCAYILSYFILHLYCGYYFVPGIVLSIPSITILLNQILEKQTNFWKLFSILLVSSPALQCIICIPNLIIETLNQRKYITPKIINNLISHQKHIFMLNNTNNPITNGTEEIANKTFSEFANYYLNKPFEESIITKIKNTELNKITKNDMFIMILGEYKKNDSQEITNNLISKNLYLIYNDYYITIYKNKTLKKINTEIIYNFKNIESDYLGLIGLYNGTFIKANNPAIIMNLNNQKNYNLFLNIYGETPNSWLIKLNNKTIFNGNINNKNLHLKISKENIPQTGKSKLTFEPNSNIKQKPLKATEDLLYNIKLNKIIIKPI